MNPRQHADLARRWLARGVRALSANVERAVCAPNALPVLIRRRALHAALRDARLAFDAEHPDHLAAAQALAARSAVIVVTAAPFENLDRVVEALSRERVTLGVLVIVDATPEVPRLVAIRDRLRAWRFALPLTRFIVQPYGRQELRFADAIEQGLSATDADYLWCAGRHFVPLAGCFEYLLKACVDERGEAVWIAASVDPQFRRHAIGLDPATLRPEIGAVLRTSGALRSETIAGEARPVVPLSPELVEADGFRDGLFGGARGLLVEGDGQVFDRRFVTNLAVADAILRLRERGVPVRVAASAAARSLCARSSDASAPWEALHDWRWLLDKRAGAVAEPNRIELVCPFHRGDVMIAIQVAHLAVAMGRSVRLHVAESLRSWVEQFAPTFGVASVPLPIASAEQTGPQLLASYQYVAQRADASPWLARCHPSGSLSDTDCNLVEFMLQEVALPRDARLLNIRPAFTRTEEDVADAIFARFEGPVVFVHPLGGWRLKSLPLPILAELRRRVHEAGLTMVQIGGATDARSPYCDDAILENFRPAQWRVILERGCALLGVDSWTAHFAAILDIPQVCFYGSTHPRHVSSKRWFTSQTSACVEMGPVVNCSPCNSLACVSFPGRQDCTGYVLDAPVLARFLASAHRACRVRSGASAHRAAATEFASGERK